MTTCRERNLRVGRRYASPPYRAFGLALGLCVILVANCRAGDLATPNRASELPALLASSNVLSEAAMARQTGSGLRPPAIINNEPNAAPRVLLWDEFKIGPLIAPANSGTVTTGGTGK
jgi:hypothetical protein